MARTPSLIEGKTEYEVAEMILRIVLAENREFHDQQHWFDIGDEGELFGIYDAKNILDDNLLPDPEALCGTSMCVAGWAAVLDGFTFSMIDKDDRELVAPILITPQGQERADVSEVCRYVGANALGLDERQEHQLFYEMNNDVVVAQLYLMAKDGAVYVEDEDGNLKLVDLSPLTDIDKDEYYDEETHQPLPYEDDEGNPISPEGITGEELFDYLLNDEGMGDLVGALVEMARKEYGQEEKTNA